MNCTHIEKILPLYAGGDLGGDEHAVVSHLRWCDGCRLLAEGYHRSQEILHSYEAPEFSSAFFDGIRSAVLEEHARTTKMRLTLFQRAGNFLKERLPDVQLRSPRRAGFALAGLLIAATLGLVLFITQSRRQPNELANAGQTLPVVVATGSRPGPDPEAPLSPPLPDGGHTEPPPRTSGPREVVREQAATFPRGERRRTTAPSARRTGSSERPAKPVEDEALPGEETYLDAISKLYAVIKKSNGVMSSTLRAEYERNLSVVDRAIASTRKAALRHRNDPEMTDFVLAAYRGKVVLLTEVAKQSQSTGSEF
jgi:hypothetical protein